MEKAKEEAKRKAFEKKQKREQAKLDLMKEDIDEDTGLCSECSMEPDNECANKFCRIPDGLTYNLFCEANPEFAEEQKNIQERLAGIVTNK